MNKKNLKSILAVLIIILILIFLVCIEINTNKEYGITKRPDDAIQPHQYEIKGLLLLFRFALQGFRP